MNMVLFPEAKEWDNPCRNLHTERAILKDLLTTSVCKIISQIVQAGNLPLP